MLSSLQPDSPSTDLVLDALQQLSSRVDHTDSHDGGFLETHRARFLHLVTRVRSLAPPEKYARVLELASYHLHLSMLMSQMGYRMHGVDLPLFAEKPSLARRAAEFEIVNRSYVLNTVGKPIQIPYDTNSVDLVICTEMLEHLTFNPVRFWSEVYRVLRSAGLIFITTPNSLSLASMLSQLKRLLLRRSVGLPVTSILHSITSGHHWKEYSLREIADYFRALSPDFRVVHSEHYSYRDMSNSNSLYRGVYWIQEHLLPQTFRSELFVVIEVRKNQGIQIADPDETIG